MRLYRGVALAALSLLLASCGSTGTAMKTGPGVTSKPCPGMIDHSRGCIYLGILSDLTTGPFHTIGSPITEADKAFWRRVNEQGGIGGYDVDVTTYVKDNKYDPATHLAEFEGMKDHVLALAQTLGSPTTAKIITPMHQAKILGVPVSWTSAWTFDNFILPSGASYCFQSMNAVDYAVSAWNARSVLSVHYAGDYGDDAAAGAKVAARHDSVPYTEVTADPTGAKTEAIAEQIARTKPGVVIMAIGPGDGTTVMTKAVEHGYKGRFIGNSPVWDQRMAAQSPSLGFLRGQFYVMYPWKPFAADSPGHTAMREALGNVTPDDSYVSGWVLQYPLKAILQRAAADHDLTRDGLFRAARQITRIDYEGMLPAGAGNLSGGPNATAFRQTVLSRPASGELTGLRPVADFAEGTTAKSYTLSAPCFNNPT